MESKIEKFGFEKDPLIKTYEEVKLENKLNEIIDHLNSQDQEGENTVCEGCGKTITSRFMQSYTKGDGMHSYCLSCDPEKQDTPEKKGEWEEIKKKLNGIAVEYNIFNRIDVIEEEVENLLSEREREVFTKEELFMLKLVMNDIHNKGNSAYDEISEKIKRELDKLNKKK